MKHPYKLMSLFRERSICALLPPIIIIARTYINKGSHTSFGVMWGDTWHGKRLWFALPFKASLVTSTTALETDKSIGRPTWSQYNKSKYADLWSLTYHQHYRTGNGQEYWQANLITITIANTLTFKASLITSTTTHWNRTRVLARQIWTRDLESLSYLPGTREASTGSDKTIGRCTNERGAKHYSN